MAMNWETKFLKPLPPTYTPSISAPAPTSSSQSIGHAQAEEWRTRLQDAHGNDNTLELAKTVLEIDKEDEELKRSDLYRRSIGPMEFELTAAVLHLMNQALRNALINGDYQAITRMSSQLPSPLTERLPDNAVDFNTKDKKKRPVIYMHFHVNDKGAPPTAREYDRVADVLEQYLDYCDAIATGDTPDPADHQVTKAIDTLIPAPSENGLPRVPYIFNVSETGWTWAPNERRFKHHEHGKNSNKIMNVIDAATRYVHPGKKYRMRWVIVVEIVSADQAAIAERLISRLGLSYTTCGGTNEVNAGSSNESAYSTPAGTYIRNWNLYGDDMRNSVERDNDSWANKLKELQSMQKTIEDRDKLDSRTFGGEAIIDETWDVKKKLAEAEESLISEVPAWCDLVERQVRALDQAKRFGRIAEMLDAAWDS